MTYSVESFTGVAGQLTYTFTSLRFLKADFLAVTVNGTGVSFSVNAAHTTITLSGVTIAGGEAIVVTRSTPAGDDDRLVDFQDGSHVRQSDLDTSSLQLLHIAQETLDVVLTGAERLELGVSGHWAGEARKIQNLASGVASTDAVNKGQLDAAAIAAGDLPVVSAADNDKGLAVVSGAWAVRTPSQMRTHLGLGTAAVLNVGTGASQVVQFDGSARYPANDGRNIDLTNNAVMTALNLRYRSTVGQLRNSTEQTPVNDAASTWSEAAGSKLVLGTLTALDNSSDVSLASNVITLSAGTWEIHWALRAYNQNNTAGNDQDLRVKLTDGVDSSSQAVYDTDYDRVDIESAGSGNKAHFTLSNTVLLKLASGGTLALRAANEDGTDIRIPSVTVTCRKVSTSTS